MNDTKIPQNPVDNAYEEVWYTTASGRTVKLRGVSPVLIEKVRVGYGKKNPPPQRPMYEAQKAGGDVELLPHDENTVETPEEKKALLDYEAAKAKYDKAINDRIMGLIAARGVVIPQEEIDDPEWWVWQEQMGVEMPDKSDPVAVRRHYLETELIGSPNDLAEILAQVMLISGVDQEVADTLRNLFRGNPQPEEDNV